MKKYFLLGLLAIAACSSRNAGYITLVNSDVQKLKIYIDGRDFTILPSHHITKQIFAGRHEIKIEGGSSITTEVDKDKTTVFDSSGLSCFVVADFSGRSSGDGIKIVERSFHQRAFQTNGKMASILGALLPKNPEEDESVLRLHQADCEIVNDDAALVNELKDLP